MSRAILLVLDSVGLGGANDAERFGDKGANTVGHILECMDGTLNCPHLARLGFFNALALASNHPLADHHKVETPIGFWGASDEISNGKDTPSGHWEIAGVPVRFDWGYFPPNKPAFPQALLDQIYSAANIKGSLCNHHGSGTDVLVHYGAEHMATELPVFYTSRDSVFQIAAHEKVFGLERLYQLCETVRHLLNDYNIGRVIARPFLGKTVDDFARTGNRRDLSVLPPEPTLLDRVQKADGQVLAVGKIADIFAHQGISKIYKANGNQAIADQTLAAMDDAHSGDLVFSNFVDFDQLYGHRRDVAGYAKALEDFDTRLPDIVNQLRDDDLLILTADHGCDPTWPGTDHTRERVPIIGLLNKPNVKSAEIGLRTSFADIGETIAAHLNLPRGAHGTSFLESVF